MRHRVVGTEARAECIECHAFFKFTVHRGPNPKFCPNCKRNRPSKYKKTKSTAGGTIADNLAPLLEQTEPKKPIVVADTQTLTHAGTLEDATPNGQERAALPIKLRASRAHTKIIVVCEHLFKYAETQIDICNIDGETLKRIQIAVNAKGWTMKVLSSND